MTEIKGLLSLLKSLPTIISFILELKKLWDEWIKEEQRREKLQQFKAAVAQARDYRNSTPLIHFFSFGVRGPDHSLQHDDTK